METNIKRWHSSFISPISSTFAEVPEEQNVVEEDVVLIGPDDGEEDAYPSDCCPDKCYVRFPFLAGDDDTPFWQGWANLRLKTFQLIENKYFETAVITMILLSSLALVSHLNIFKDSFFRILEDLLD